MCEIFSRCRGTTTLGMAVRRVLVFVVALLIGLGIAVPVKAEAAQTDLDQAHHHTNRRVLREYKNTMGPDGLIETKWVHSRP